MRFFDQSFLLSHCKSILDFYTHRVVDDTGGYHQNYLDDGSLFNTHLKQLVSSTRIIVNYATASIVFNNEDYRRIAKHGLDYLEKTHWQAESQTYAWTLNNHQPLDMTQQAYGYAFVLLAYSALFKAKIVKDKKALIRTYNLLEERFWQAEYGLYADEISPSGELSEYRGQNSNMHLCEAMLAAYDATKDVLFLDRASKIASNIAQRQAALTDGLIWEHYTPNFQPDWEYNKDDPKNLYRPWGFQPGHQTEWTKLLLTLHRFRPESWQVDAAQTLFDRAYDIAWDNENGGLIYGFAPNGNWCDTDKYFWVQAESFAAAAMLYHVTNEARYLERYNSLWNYSWEHMVDHKYGAWYRLLDQQNNAYNNEKSAAGAKCDYHTLGACFEVLRTLRHNA